MPKSGIPQIFRRHHDTGTTSSSTEDGATSALLSTDGPTGMKVLQDPTNALVDIVFIHGLTGNRETTWTHQNNVYWPETLLGGDLPRARIMSFGYDADVVRFMSIASSNRIRDHGKSLARAIANLRNQNGRAIIFVAHSLGGLVCEQALLTCRNSSESSLNDVLSCTVGIAFLGTPHASNLAKWGGVLARLVNLLRRTNKEVVDTLEPGSDVLASIEQDFQHMLIQRPHISIFCFYEGVAITTVGMVVPPESAILAQYESESIAANHVDMTKFNGKNDPGYQSVLGRLRHWYQQLETVQFQANVHNSGVAPPETQSEDVKEAAVGSSTPHTYSGTVNSAGGPVLQGNVHSAKDINFTWGSAR